MGMPGHGHGHGHSHGHCHGHGQAWPWLAMAMAMDLAMPGHGHGHDHGHGHAWPWPWPWPWLWPGKGAARGEGRGGEKRAPHLGESRIFARGRGENVENRNCRLPIGEKSKNENFGTQNHEICTAPRRNARKALECDTVVKKWGAMNAARGAMNAARGAIHAENLGGGPYKLQTTKYQTSETSTYNIPSKQRCPLSLHFVP